MLLWQARMELLMVLICCLTGALVMRVCHTMDPVFDDPNLIGFGGLPAVMSLAERAGLHDLVDQHVTVPGSAGANAAVKVAGMVAGMVVGADSISDLGLDPVAWTPRKRGCSSWDARVGGLLRSTKTKP